MADTPRSPSEELASLPLGDLIRGVALSIADGQMQMDRASMETAEFMSGQYMLRDSETGLAMDPDGSPSDTPTMIDSRIHFGFHYEAGRRVADRLSMMELGFVPTFYQFVDTTIEIKLALHLRKTTKDERAAAASSGSRHQKTRRRGLSSIDAKTLDARYSASYDYDADLACTLSTKIVPVPPPVVLEDRVRLLTEELAAERGLVERTAPLTLAATLATGPDGRKLVVESVPDILPTFTIEAWVRLDQSGEAPVLVEAFDDPDGVGDPLWRLRVIEHDMAAFDIMVPGAAPLTARFRTPLVPERWTHLAVVGTPSALVVHTDQRRDGGLRHGAWSVPGPARLDVLPGETAPAANLLELRVWSVARSRQELIDRSRAHLPADWPGLLASWPEEPTPKPD